MDIMEVYEDLEKTCPVCGIFFTEEGQPQDYQGTTYVMCSALCLKKFLEDPEKYRENADDEVEE